MTLIHTLARVDEILRLAWADVNFETQTVTLWTRKRKDGAYEPDPMPMNADLKEILYKRWKDREQEQYVFFNKLTGDRYYHRPKLMAALCKRAGIEPLGFHALRHFMASYLSDKEKASTQAVSKLLRHKNLRTTEIYLHSIDESQRIAMTGIEGKFTLNLSDPQPRPATEENEGEADSR